MKRGAIFLAMLFFFFGFSSHIANAQEETGEKDENIYIVKKGDKDGSVWISIDKDHKAHKDGHKDIHKDMAIFKHHDVDIKEGSSHIIIRSKGEVTELVIDGDAVITIKDGKVHVEGEKVTIDTEVMKKGEKKVVKEKKVVEKIKEKK